MIVFLPPPVVVIPTVRVSELLERIESSNLTYPVSGRKGWKRHSQFRDILRDARYAKIVFEKSDVDLLEAATYKSKLWFYRLFNLIYRERRNQTEQKIKALLAYAGTLLGHVSYKKCGYKAPVIAVMFRKILHFSGNDSEDHLISNLQKYSRIIFVRCFRGEIYGTGCII